MKQKALAIAGCIAAVLPSVAMADADVLPGNLLGLNLGEISSTSFLNQPFKGVIPLLSKNSNAKNITVKLAPKSIFDEIGAEKHPILNNLSFQITNQGNKAVILISSHMPINLPFLNFVLEIKESGHIVYQDYTVLLDPVTESKKTKVDVASTYISTNYSQSSEPNGIKPSDIYQSAIEEEKILNTEDLLRKNGKLLLDSLSSQASASEAKKLNYKTKSGDSLSKIAQKQNSNKISLEEISRLIYQKNPKAFVRGDVDRLRRGVILSLPSESEINALNISQKIITRSKRSRVSSAKIVADKKIKSADATPRNIYKVLEGDNLSKITKKHTTKDTSFTKTMSFIFSNNPTAFVDNNKNRLKVGVELIVPSDEKASSVEQIVSKIREKPSSPQLVKIIAKADTVSVKSKVYESVKPNQAVKSDVKIKLKTKVELKENQYNVRRGDTLSQITRAKGHKEVPFAKMLKIIYLNNPAAFVNGRISRLSTGAVITIPPLSDINLTPEKVELISKKEESTAVLTEKVEVIDKPNSQTIENVVLTAQNKNKEATTGLVKRIRELRKELEQTKKSLTNLKGSLSNKETLLEQKNIQLESLNTLIAKTDPSIFAGTVLKTSSEKKPIKESAYKPKSKAEMAKMKRDLLNKQTNTREQLAKIKDLKNQIAEPIQSSSGSQNIGQFKEYSVSSLLKLSNSNYAYLSLALILCLLLIRYRRELYALTYSKININEKEVYYPVPETDKYDLSEKNINYAESVLDDFAKNYEPSVDEIKDDVESTQVKIDPVLVEAKEDLFKSNTDENQIKHCEHLITELFDDLDESKNTVDSKEWKNIEEVCDSYIEKIKVSEPSTKANKTGVLPNEATDFNDMMSDLLESLDKVDKSVKQNNLQDEDFPEIVEDSLYKRLKSQGQKDAYHSNL